jgi:hypothetical protein
MKRSEVIDIIDEVLYEHEIPLLQGIAKEILGRLEKIGMMPPLVGDDFADVRNYYWESEKYEAE